ncbi:MAG: spore germination protein GerPB [Bacillota bacterium]
MNLSVYQCITVQQLRIGTVTNSSVLQIGTSGSIKALSHVNNSPALESIAAPNDLEQEKKEPVVLLPEPVLM